MLRLFFLAVLLLGTAGGAAYWTLARDDDSAEAQTQLYRWVNVTVEVPEDSGLTVTRHFWGVDDVTPAVLISPLSKGETGVVIDAKTGAILLDKTDDEDRAAIDQVLRTLSVSPLDRSTAPWPYTAALSNAPRETWGEITYVTPDTVSGIVVIVEMGDGGEGSGYAIQVTNGRSTLAIDAGTGAVFEKTTSIQPEDKEAFDRFLSAVEPIGP